MEFIEFHRDEPAPKRKVSASQETTWLLLFVHGDSRHAVGDGAEQQQRGFNQNERQFKNIFTGRSAAVPFTRTA
jgi:hypothetical protein